MSWLHIETATTRKPVGLGSDAGHQPAVDAADQRAPTLLGLVAGRDRGAGRVEVADAAAVHLHPEGPGRRGRLALGGGDDEGLVAADGAAVGPVAEELDAVAVLGDGADQLDLRGVGRLLDARACRRGGRGSCTAGRRRTRPRPRRSTASRGRPGSARPPSRPRSRRWQLRCGRRCRRCPGRGRPSRPARRARRRPRPRRRRRGHRWVRSRRRRTSPRCGRGPAWRGGSRWPGRRPTPDPGPRWCG